MLCHSTLGNSLTREWLERMRLRANDVTDVFGNFGSMSFMCAEDCPSAAS